MEQPEEMNSQVSQMCEDSLPFEEACDREFPSHKKSIEDELEELKEKHKLLEASNEVLTQKLAKFEHDSGRDKHEVEPSSSYSDNSRMRFYVDAISEINLRIAKGQEADLLLYVHSLTEELPGNFEHMGICVYEDVIESAVEKANNSLDTFAYHMCNVIFKSDGAKYFSVGGTNRTKKTMETLALPSGYTTGFVSFVETVGRTYKLTIPERYGKVTKTNKRQLREKVGRDALVMWLTKLRRKIRPNVQKTK